MFSKSVTSEHIAMLYESPYDRGFAIPDVDITSLVLDHNLKDSPLNKPAIIDGLSGDVVYTYASLRDKIRLFAGFLQEELHVSPGDVVAYLSYNTVWSLLFFTLIAVLTHVTDILSYNYSWFACCGCRRVRLQSGVHS